MAHLFPMARRGLLGLVAVTLLGGGPAAGDAPKSTDEAPLRVSSGYGVGGLVLWIAADCGVTLDNNCGVRQLTDRTGNFILTPNDAGQEPVLVPNALNGKPVFRFNGDQSLYSPDDFGGALNRDMTIIVVSMSTTTLTSRERFALYLGQNATPQANRALPYLEGKLLFDGQFVGCVGPPQVSNTFVMEGATLNPGLTEATFYRNGKKVLTGTVAEENKRRGRAGSVGFEDLSEGVTFGAATDPVCGWEGDIAEALVYNHQLTPAEMQQVWINLSSKYGLTARPPVLTSGPPALN